jgi:hypothetical protein
LVRKRAKRKSRLGTWLISLFAVVIAIIVILYYFFGSGQGSGLVGSTVPPALYSSMYAAANSAYGPSNASLASRFGTYQGTPLTSNGLPEVAYIGGNYCPFCAAERWPLTIALMRFGNFSGLELMQSSPTDSPPNVYTLSFESSSYTSKYIAFSGFEIYDRSGGIRESAPADIATVWQAYQRSIPIVDLANSYVVNGASFLPQSLAGRNWTQIVNLVAAGTGVGAQIKEIANAYTAAICAIDSSQPSNICNDPAISAIHIAGFHSSVIAAFNTGAPISSPTAWARVQKGQIAWSTKSSVPIR